MFPKVHPCVSAQVHSICGKILYTAEYNPKLNKIAYFM